MVFAIQRQAIGERTRPVISKHKTEEEATQVLQKMQADLKNEGWLISGGKIQFQGKAKGGPLYSYWIRFPKKKATS